MLLKIPTQKNINIVDSIMGSGKTSWAIQYMNEAPTYQKFIYITPFKTEVERVYLLLTVILSNQTVIVLVKQS